MFEVSAVVKVVDEFLINVLSNIVEFVSKEFNQMIELVMSVNTSLELFICEFVEFEFVKFEADILELTYIAESFIIEFVVEES